MTLRRLSWASVVLLFGGCFDPDPASLDIDEALGDSPETGTTGTGPTDNDVSP